MSKTLELLKSMRGKIATGWTQGCSARNRQGNPVVPSSPEACQWCLLGAVTAMESAHYRTTVEQRTNVWRIINQLLENRNELQMPSAFNDNPARTQREVLELLDEAISVASIGGYN